MAIKTIYTEVEVDVDLSDFDTEDLVEELEERGRFINSDDTEVLLVKAWLHDREGRKEEAYASSQQSLVLKCSSLGVHNLPSLSLTRIPSLISTPLVFQLHHPTCLQHNSAWRR